MKKKEADIYAITHLSRNAKDRAIYAVYFAFLCTSLLLGLVLMVIWPAFISSIDSTLTRFVLPFLFIAAGILVWIVGVYATTKMYNRHLQKAVYKIPNAHERIDILPLDSISVMDSWYKEGAIVVRKKEDRALDLFYNWLMDTKLISGGRVTIYEISLEQFHQKYPFINRHKGFLKENFLVLPIKDTSMPGKKKEVSDLMTYPNGYSYIRYVGWFADFVNGRHYVPDYGICYDYKDEIEDFMET